MPSPSEVISSALQHPVVPAEAMHGARELAARAQLVGDGAAEAVRPARGLQVHRDRQPAAVPPGSCACSSAICGLAMTYPSPGVRKSVHIPISSSVALPIPSRALAGTSIPDSLPLCQAHADSCRSDWTHADSCRYARRVTNENGRPASPDELPVEHEDHQPGRRLEHRLLPQSRGLTQEELGELIGGRSSATSPQTSGHGTAAIPASSTPTQLIALAVALGIPLVAFFLPPEDDGDRRPLRVPAARAGRDYLGMADLMGAAMHDNEHDTTVMDGLPAAVRERLRRVPENASWAESSTSGGEAALTRTSAPRRPKTLRRRPGVRSSARRRARREATRGTWRKEDGE